MGAIEVVKEVAQFASSEGAEALATFARVIGKGAKGIPVSATKPNQPTLGLALRFLLYMSLLTAVITLPTAMLAGAPSDSALFLGFSAGLEGLTWLAAGVCFHTAMRIVGGKGRLIQGIEVACLLSAFAPLLQFLLTPIQVKLIPLEARLENPWDISSVVYNSARDWSLWERCCFWVVFAASTAIVIVLCLAFLRSFRRMHRLSPLRALAGFALGFAALAVFETFFVSPLSSRILRLFTKA